MQTRASGPDLATGAEQALPFGQVTAVAEFARPVPARLRKPRMSFPAFDVIDASIVSTGGKDVRPQLIMMVARFGEQCVDFANGAAQVREGGGEPGNGHMFV